VRGYFADPVEAHDWYVKAAELGSGDTIYRINALSLQKPWNVGPSGYDNGSSRPPIKHLGIVAKRVMDAGRQMPRRSTSRTARSGSSRSALPRASFRSRLRSKDADQIRRKSPIMPLFQPSNA
jgi:hypothetical protein